ncbi:MAG: hypothetical protein QXR13_03735 [Candidatus Bathyarchaeia archaeon]
MVEGLFGKTLLWKKGVIGEDSIIIEVYRTGRVDVPLTNPCEILKWRKFHSLWLRNLGRFSIEPKMPI